MSRDLWVYDGVTADPATCECDACAEAREDAYYGRTR